MNQNIKALAERLLQTGYDDLPEREQRVLRRMARRVAISQNINERFHDKLVIYACASLKRSWCSRAS